MDLPFTVVSVEPDADAQGLIVVAAQSVESSYRMSDSGLLLPKHVTPLPSGWLKHSPYPEFAAELVAVVDQSGTKPYLWKPTLAIPAKPKKQQSVMRSLGSIVSNLDTTYDWLDCPVCNLWKKNDYDRISVSNLIVHLNDNHYWTRERIADHLETLPIDLSIRKVA